MATLPASSDPWRTARTLEDLAQATIAFLRGDLGETPVHGGPPDPETAPLIADLMRMNAAGFITVDSQPGEVSPGWSQRAYVEGLCTEATAARIEAAVLGTELVLLSFAPGAIGEASITVSLDGRTPNTFLGRADPSYFNDLIGNGSPELDAELARAWTLQIFDPVWGRSDMLLSALVAALEAA